MNNDYLGERLLAELQELEVLLMQSGREGLLSLIEACIDGGWSTEGAIVAKVRQIGGPYYDFEIPKLLAIHASPLARPQLWEADKKGRYRTIDAAFDPEDLSFWRPAFQPPADKDLAA